MGADAIFIRRGDARFDRRADALSRRDSCLSRISDAGSSSVRPKRRSECEPIFERSWGRQQAARIHDVCGIESVFDSGYCLQADRGNIRGQPGHVLGPDCVVMRECCPVVDERLLDGTLDLKILVHLTPWLLPEPERKVETRPGGISVADVTSNPGTDFALADFLAQNRDRVTIQRGDVAPHGRRLAHVGGDVAVEQEIADVGKIILG